MIVWSAGPSRTSRPRTWRSAIVNSKGWSNQVSMVSLTSLNSQFAERPEQDRFLRMDAVLGFVPDARLSAVNHRIDALVAAGRGEALKEDRAALGNGKGPGEAREGREG